jgi:hypothetical protein
MGIVIPFKPRAALVKSSAISEEKQRVLSELDSGCDCSGLLVAARPLLGHLHKQYGFSVLTDGLPDNPSELCKALFLLVDALDMLAPEVKSPVYWTFAAKFGPDALGWVDDSYGSDTELALPTCVTPSELANFIRPRLTRRRA